MAIELKIDYVSDLSCPLCAIGLKGLEDALARLEGEVTADLTFQPFELNSSLAPGGRNVLQYVQNKYGSPTDQIRGHLEQIRVRAERAGFTINNSDDDRVYNTLNAHRLMAWAQEQGKQLQLARTLQAVYLTDRTNPDDPAVLAGAAAAAGLDPAEARAIIASDRYTAEVRAAEAIWLSRGVRSVPSIFIDDQFFSGSQTADEFESAFRSMIASRAVVG